PDSDENERVCMGTATLRDSAPAQASFRNRLPASLGDLSQYLMRWNNSQEMQLVLKLSGYVDASLLNRVIRMLADCQPVIGCRFVEHWYRPYWERRPDLDSIDFCQVVNTADAEAALDQYMTTPNDPRTDPVFEARIFRSDRDILCFKSSHV